LDERRFPLRTAPSDFSYVVLLVMTLACERQLREAQTIVTDDDEHFQMYQYRGFNLLERLRKDKYPHDTVMEVVHIWKYLQHKLQDAYNALEEAVDTDDATAMISVSTLSEKVAASEETEGGQEESPRPQKRRLSEQGGGKGPGPNKKSRAH
jgi:hypothetical protein